MTAARVERLANLVTYLLNVDRPVTLTTIIQDVPGYPESRESARVQFDRDKNQLASQGVTVEMSGTNEEGSSRS